MTCGLYSICKHGRPISWPCYECSREKEIDERSPIYSRNDVDAYLAMATESIRAQRDKAMRFLNAYVSRYAGILEHSEVERAARFLIAEWEVHEVALGRSPYNKNSTSALSGNPSPTMGTEVTPAADAAKPPR